MVKYSDECRSIPLDSIDSISCDMHFWFYDSTNMVWFYASWLWIFFKWSKSNWRYYGTNGTNEKIDRSRNYLDKSGAVNGGAIKFANLKLRQNSPTSKLIAKGKDFTVNILGTGSLNQMLEVKSNLVELLSRQNRKVINFVA